MALKYTTVQKFWKFLGLNESLDNYQPSNVQDGVVNDKETVASSPVAAGSYYLTQKGVNSDTLVLYAGSTALTLTTDYTFDADKSLVTITSAGATALTGEDLSAFYEYSALGKDLDYNETVRLLEQSEKRMEGRTNCVFADQSIAAPDYLNVQNEMLTGKGQINNLYDLEHGPVIKLQTTVDGAYTTGGATLTLTDASGFPTTATIVVGGNKVTYTSKSGNDLTVPTSTPSIDDGAIVRGECIEVSTSPQGVDPTYTVLLPDTDYAIDYDTGEFQLLRDYYFQSDTAYDRPIDGVKDRIRVSYQHAWHNVGEDAEIPSDIEQVVHMMAGRQVVQRTVLKSLSGQRDNFNPQSFGFSKLDIDEILRDYVFLRNRNV